MKVCLKTISPQHLRPPFQYKSQTPNKPPAQFHKIMATQLTADDAKQSLNAHVAAKGVEIFEKYGPTIEWKQLLLILEDRAVVRYPCEVAFDAGPLQPGEMAFPLQKGDNPEAGFTMCIHPCFMMQMEYVPHIVLYQLVLVNYGDFASADDAETFGAAALGLAKEDYYHVLCRLSDQLATGKCE